VKIEAFNPLGSGNGRLALGVIEDAKRKGQFLPLTRWAEAGNSLKNRGIFAVCCE
jgi:cysteine synthase